MKVLTITTLFPNEFQPLHGVFIKERIKHLNQLCEVRVVAPIIFPPPSEGWVNKNTKAASWKNMMKIPYMEKQWGLTLYHPRIVHIPKIGVFFSGFNYFLFTYRYIKKIKQEYDFDIIDVHWAYPDGFAAMLLGRMLDVPVIISCRGTDVNLYLDIPILKNLVGFALKKCSNIITVSQSLKNKILSLGIKDDKITVVSNGVDTDKFRPLDRAKTRQKLGVTLNKKIILSIGHLVERKGFHYIIDAMSIMINTHGYKDLLLLIVGEGAYRRNLEELIEKYCLTQNILLVGAKSFNEIQDWHNVADIFCLASSREGWPNVLFETLACGNPVVTTDAWGNSEVICSSDYGIVVKEQTGKALAIAFREALEKKWNRKKIIAYAQDNTWDKVAQKVFDLFIKV